MMAAIQTVQRQYSSSTRTHAQQHAQMSSGGESDEEQCLLARWSKADSQTANRHLFFAAD